MDMLVFSGNLKDENTIKLDGEIYGEQSFLKLLKPQPKKRKLLNYLENDKVYLSAKNIDKLDTFIFRMLSIRLSNFTIAELVQEFFILEGKDLFSMLNGEVIIDTKNGNYLFGLKTLESSKEISLFLEKLQNISIKRDLLGNDYLLIGEDSFEYKTENWIMKENQIAMGQFKYKYMNIDCKGYIEKNKLRIKAEIKIDKNREEKNDKNL
ncbi:MAG: hypothetical protein Q7K36_01710 [Fusobacterium sp. JB020]|nr:hypothetical protein [Fusobacterium sp. JB020]